MSDAAVRVDDDVFAGWRRDPVAFIEQHLINLETGKPFVLLASEREFLRYALATDSNGRLLFPELIYESVLLEELYKRGMTQPEIAPNLRAGDGVLMAWHHEPVAPWQTEACQSASDRDP
jgi:hypothetical protein